MGPKRGELNVARRNAMRYDAEEPSQRRLDRYKQQPIPGEGGRKVDWLDWVAGLRGEKTREAVAAVGFVQPVFYRVCGELFFTDRSLV